jgi:hypothetical protein
LIFINTKMFKNICVKNRGKIELTFTVERIHFHSYDYKNRGKTELTLTVERIHFHSLGYIGFHNCCTAAVRLTLTR